MSRPLLISTIIVWIAVFALATYYYIKYNKPDDRGRGPRK